MSEQPPSDRSMLRAADADRDRVAAELGAALADGQLSTEEHAERLDAVYQAKTLGELVSLTDDLQSGGLPVPAPVARAPVPAAPGVPTSDTAVSIFSATNRRGRWRVPARLRSICVFGGAAYDMRDAEFDAQEIVLNVFCLFGGVDVQLPPGVRVVNKGFAIFGGIDTPSELMDAPTGVTVVLRGICLFGGVSVRHKASRLGTGEDRRELS